MVLIIPWEYLVSGLVLHVLAVILSLPLFFFIPETHEFLHGIFLQIIRMHEFLQWCLQFFLLFMKKIICFSCWISRTFFVDLVAILQRAVVKLGSVILQRYRQPGTENSEHCQAFNGYSEEGAEDQNRKDLRKDVAPHLQEKSGTVQPTTKKKRSNSENMGELSRNIESLVVCNNSVETASSILRSIEYFVNKDFYHCTIDEHGGILKLPFCILIFPALAVLAPKVLKIVVIQKTKQDRWIQVIPAIHCTDSEWCTAVQFHKPIRIEVETTTNWTDGDVEIQVTESSITLDWQKIDGVNVTRKTDSISFSLNSFAGVRAIVQQPALELYHAVFVKRLDGIPDPTQHLFYILLFSGDFNSQKAASFTLASPANEAVIERQLLVVRPPCAFKACLSIPAISSSLSEVSFEIPANCFKIYENQMIKIAKGDCDAAMQPGVSVDLNYKVCSSGSSSSKLYAFYWRSPVIPLSEEDFSGEQATEIGSPEATLREISFKDATKTATIGPKGGKMDLHECRVIFRKNAVKKNTEFKLSIKNKRKNFPKKGMPITPILDLQPSMEFDEPVQVKMRTWFCAAKGKKLSAQVYVKEDGGDWELDQDNKSIPLTDKNEVSFYVRHFCEKICMVSDSDKNEGLFCLLNDVYIQRGTGTIASVFCQDLKALSDCEADFNKGEYVKVRALHNVIKGKLWSQFQVAVSCVKPPKVNYLQSPSLMQLREMSDMEPYEYLDFIAENFPPEYKGPFLAQYKVESQDPTNEKRKSIFLSRPFPIVPVTPAMAPTFLL